MEVGAGAGAVTAAIVQQTDEDAVVIAVEKDAELAERLRARQLGVQVVTADAVTLPAILADHGLDSADVIVSVLPWTLFRPQQQRELLAMLESSVVSVPMDYGFSAFGQRAEVSTRDIPFIACGAFSGLDEILRERRALIGFRGATAKAAALTLDEVSAFQKFGFLPELVGRFARIVSFPPLPRETLRRILIENVLPQFQNEFQGEGLKLSVTDAALDHLITRSEKRGTGARGLHTELVAAVYGNAAGSVEDVAVL